MKFAFNGLKEMVLLAHFYIKNAKIPRNLAIFEQKKYVLR